MKYGKISAVATKNTIPMKIFYIKCAGPIKTKVLNFTERHKNA